MFEFEDDTSQPGRNEPLIKLYELLTSLLTALSPTITSTTIRDGAGERLNGYIDELIQLTGDGKLRDFKVEIRHMRSGAVSFVTGEVYARQLSGVVNYLFRTNEVIGWYCTGPPEPKFAAAGHGTTITNKLTAEQQAHQSTSVQIELHQTIIKITEALTNIERDYPDKSSKEHKFAKALKKSLPAVKDTLSVIALVLKVAGQVGLDPKTALKLLGLG